MLDHEVLRCPLCKQPIDKFGDHATCCTKSGGVIIRHNALRDLVEDFANDGMLSPVLESKEFLVTRLSSTWQPAEGES